MRRHQKALLLPVLLLTACGSGPFSNPLIQTINLTLSPSQLTLNPGQTSKVQVSGVAAGTTSAVTGLELQALEVPAGLSVLPSTGMLSVTASNTATPGSYTIPVKATTFGGAGQAVLAVTVAPPSATKYQVTFTPSDPSLAQGQSLRVTATAKLDGLTTTALHITSVTGALAVTLDPNDPVGFSISAASQPTGAYTLLVTSTDGTFTQVDPLVVTVTAPQ